MSKIKRVIIVILFLGIVAGLGYAMYAVFFAPAAPPVAAPENVNAVPGGGLPQAGIGSVLNRPAVPLPSGAGTLVTASPIARGGATVSPTLVSSPSLGATLASDGKTVRYYDRSTNKFMYVDADGVARELSGEIFPDITDITWSGDVNKAVLSFPDGSKIVYDFTTKKQATLPSGWEDFSFSPDSDELAAKSLSDISSNQYLVISDADGQNARPIEPMGTNDYNVKVAWSPTGDVVAMSSTGDPSGGGFGSRDVLFIGQNGENFPATQVEGLGFDPLWSPDGKILLYSSAGSDDDFIPRLWTVTGSGENRGGNRRKINLFTLASKCTFATATVAYCAAPDSMPEGAGLSPEVMDGIPDSVYRVNALTGGVTLIGRPDTDTTIDRLSVSADGATLFFVDQATGNIKKMMLK